jgi:uncharacterized membrane protein
MIDVVFLLLTVVFVIIATLAALATTSSRATVRVAANRMVNFSAAGFLVSSGLTAWFIFWPPI